LRRSRAASLVAPIVQSGVLSAHFGQTEDTNPEETTMTALMLAPPIAALGLGTLGLIILIVIIVIVVTRVL